MRNKYNARKVEYQGITFDSAQERDRYIALRCMEIRGEISQLRMQVRFTLIPDLWRVETVQLKTKTKEVRRLLMRGCSYTCDFLYREGDRIVIEDVKSRYTYTLSDYILRRKMLVQIITRHTALRRRSVFVFRESIAYKNKLTIKNY